VARSTRFRLSNLPFSHFLSSRAERRGGLIHWPEHALNRRRAEPAPLWTDGGTPFLVSRFGNGWALADGLGEDLVGGLDPGEWTGSGVPCGGEKVAPPDG